MQAGGGWTGRTSECVQKFKRRPNELLASWSTPLDPWCTTTGTMKYNYRYHGVQLLMTNDV